MTVYTHTWDPKESKEFFIRGDVFNLLSHADITKIVQVAVQVPCSQGVDQQWGRDGAQRENNIPNTSSPSCEDKHTDVQHSSQRCGVVSWASKVKLLPAPSLPCLHICKHLGFRTQTQPQPQWSAPRHIQITALCLLAKKKKSSEKTSNRTFFNVLLLFL